VPLQFFIDIKSFRSHYGPGVDSTSNRNEYQEHFLGGKGGRCVKLTTYHHPVPLSRNLVTLTSWNAMGLLGTLMGLIHLLLLDVFTHFHVTYTWLLHATAFWQRLCCGYSSSFVSHKGFFSETNDIDSSKSAILRG